ncbi:MAG TPA: hypothetical protein VEX70_03545 [Pyrinomonadaceae bacterium]|jgi:hypothetical protein|nr:hypothetical protein [Pyrinomonadaceae bacterium]
MRESLKRVGLLIPTELANRSNLLRRAAKQVFTWVIVLGLVYTQEPPVTIALQRAANNSSSPTPIRLVLQTSRRTYRAGEPIELTAYLENMSQDRAYYVGKELGKFFITESFHYIELQITDEKRREAPIGRGAAASIWKPGTTIAEKLAQEYVQLQPRMIYGQKDAGNITLRPGQYRLVATYHEVEALRWTEAERETLPVPVWAQPLVSNTVRIAVIP